MATEFHYQHPFPLGEDKTEYYLLTKDYVSVSEFEGQPILKIQKEGLTQMANAYNFRCRKNPCSSKRIINV
jgi:fumarate hydratase class I